MYGGFQLHTSMNCTTRILWTILHVGGSKPKDFGLNYPNTLNLLQQDLIRFLFARKYLKLNLGSNFELTSTGFRSFARIIESLLKHYIMFTYPGEHQSSPWLSLGMPCQALVVCTQCNLCTVWLSLLICSEYLLIFAKKRIWSDKNLTK